MDKRIMIIGIFILGVFLQSCGLMPAVKEINIADIPEEDLVELIYSKSLKVKSIDDTAVKMRSSMTSKYNTLIIAPGRHEISLYGIAYDSFKRNNVISSEVNLAYDFDSGRKYVLLATLIKREKDSDAELRFFILPRFQKVNISAGKEEGIATIVNPLITQRIIELDGIEITEDTMNIVTSTGQHSVKVLITDKDGNKIVQNLDLNLSKGEKLKLCYHHTKGTMLFYRGKNQDEPGTYSVYYVD